ncbi:unnamed protein product, partial [Thlaspi arvense]
PKRRRRNKGEALQLKRSEISIPLPFEFSFLSFFSSAMEKSDQDLGSNRNLLPRQLDFSVPAAAVETKMDSLHESGKEQSHSVLDSQSSREDQREEDLPRQPQSPPSGAEEQQRLGVSSLIPPSSSPVRSSQIDSTEVSTQDATPPQKPPLHRFGHQLQKNPLAKCRVRYCECFASGSYCNGCNCLNCHNNLEKETSRQEAITGILERNPDAFKPKIAGSPHGMRDLQEDVRQILIMGKHSKGCHCKKSGCLKKYCECYQAGVLCSENCRCQDCKNFDGSEERNALLRGPQVSETYIQQTTNAAVSRAINMSGYLNAPESRKRKIKEASHSVAARGSSVVPHNQTVSHVIRNGDTSLFSVPNNKAVSGSTTCTYRSSLSNTIQPRHVKELCSLLVSKSVDVANKLSGAKCETEKGKKYEKDPSLDPAQGDGNEINDSPDCVLDAVRMDEKPISPATRALMCDDEHVIIAEKETSARVKTSQEKEDADTSSEVYLEQERQILSSFRDYLIQFSNRVSINGTNTKTNTKPSRREPEAEERSHRDSSLGKENEIG